MTRIPSHAERTAAKAVLAGLIALGGWFVVRGLRIVAASLANPTETPLLFLDVMNGLIAVVAGILGVIFLVIWVYEVLSSPPPSPAKPAPLEEV